MLYFLYGARLDPELLAEVAPSARMVAVAHLPETRLHFPLLHPELGGLPSVAPSPGHTVWGVVVELTEEEAAALDAGESAHGRRPEKGWRAVDRQGNAYEVVVHVAAGELDGEATPSATYLEFMVRGGRHWQLPTGWLLGLEEYGEDPLV